MNTSQKRIENPCDKIVGRVLVLMQADSVPRVMLTDDDNPVFAILFNKADDPCECSVHKITAVEEGITLEVRNKITGGNYKATSRHEATPANPVWPNDTLEAMTDIFRTKEDNIICCRCESGNVTCKTMINPNTKDFDHYIDDSFQYEWCDNCKSGTIINDTSEVRKGVSQKYKESKDAYNTESQLALCHITWRNDMKETKVSIAPGNVPEKHDDTIFFHYNSLFDFMILVGYGEENFIVMGCPSFTGLRNEE